MLLTCSLSPKLLLIIDIVPGMFHPNLQSYMPYMPTNTCWNKFRGNGGNNGKNGGFQGRAGGGGKYEANEYCWLHGWCMHKGEHCFRRLPGHNTNATKENDMGGNPKGCKP